MGRSLERVGHSHLKVTLVTESDLFVEERKENDQPEHWKNLACASRCVSPSMMPNPPQFYIYLIRMTASYLSLLHRVTSTRMISSARTPVDLFELHQLDEQIAVASTIQHSGTCIWTQPSASFRR